MSRPRNLALPPASPYAGKMSIDVHTGQLKGFHEDGNEELDLRFKADIVASNAAPHVLKRLVLFGVEQSEVVMTTTTPPPEEFQSVTSDEVIDMALNRRAGKNIWHTLRRVVSERTDCGLIAVGEGEGELMGDFGFGLEWLNLFHGPLTGNGIVNNIMLKRSAELNLQG